MPRAATIKFRNGTRKRPILKRVAPCHWRAYVVTGGHLIGEGRTKGEAAKRLQLLLDALYEELRSYSLPPEEVRADEWDKW